MVYGSSQLAESSFSVTGSSQSFSSILSGGPQYKVNSSLPAVSLTLRILGVLGSIPIPPEPEKESTRPRNLFSYKGRFMLRKMAGLPKGRRSLHTTANMGSLMVDPPQPQTTLFSIKAAQNGDITSHRSHHTHAAAHLPNPSVRCPSCCAILLLTLTQCSPRFVSLCPSSQIPSNLRLNTASS